jgi:hypothetical protein
MARAKLSNAMFFRIKVGYNVQNTVIDVTIERKHEFMSFRSEPFNTWQE